MKKYQMQIATDGSVLAEFDNEQEAIQYMEEVAKEDTIEFGEDTPAHYYEIWLVHDDGSYEFVAYNAKVECK